MSAYALDMVGLAGDPASPVHRLDPRAKVLALIGVTLVAVSAPLAAWPAYVACAAAVAAVAATAGVPWRTVWHRGRVVLPIVLLTAASVPFLHPDGFEAGLAVFAAAAAKAAIGTAGAVVLGATTSFPSVLRALEALRVPRLFVLVMGFAYRYLFVLVDEARRMRTALAARGHAPRHALQAGGVGRLAAALFLRAHARGERVHVAMLARGWSGRISHAEPLAFARGDVLFVALVVGIPLATRLVLEMTP